jgi:GMP synthase (glutamine-hydrolysing)
MTAPQLGGPFAMKPILILQHLTDDAPAYLGTWLQRNGLPFEVRDTEAGQAYPADCAAYSGLCVLGGEMSANDDLPSLRQAERLIVEAMAAYKPVLGICLGGQLMARALGARVVASLAPEIGWQTLQLHDTETARHWFGAAPEQMVCHWHYEAFELPAGAHALGTSAACQHQAFSIGPHLATQFHVEMDEAKLRLWASSTAQLYGQLQAEFPGSVQGPRALLEGLRVCLPRQQRLADALFERWADGLLR